MFSEIKRIAKDIHRFRFGKEIKLDSTKLRIYEREIRLRLKEGKSVPGFKAYKPT